MCSSIFLADNLRLDGLSYSVSYRLVHIISSVYYIQLRLAQCFENACSYPNAELSTQVQEINV